MFIRLSGFLLNILVTVREFLGNNRLVTLSEFLCNILITCNGFLHKKLLLDLNECENVQVSA